MAFRHAMIFGNVGVGKTQVVNKLLQGLPDSKAAMVINMSAQTSSNSLQNTIEGKLESTQILPPPLMQFLS